MSYTPKMNWQENEAVLAADVNRWEKGIADAHDALGGAGDMKKSVYDTDNNGAADKADKLTVARRITLTGAVTGYADFDGSAAVSIAATLANLSAGKITSGTMAAARIAQDGNNRFFTDAERSKLAGVEEAANHYVHPATHPAAIIEQNAGNRFVTDAQMAAWSAKATAVTYTVTIPSTGWGGNPQEFGYYKIVSVTGLLGTDNPIADVVLSGNGPADRKPLEEWAKVGRILTTNGSITVYCYEEPPSMNLTVQLKVVR